MKLTIRLESKNQYLLGMISDEIKKLAEKMGVKEREENRPKKYYIQSNGQKINIFRKMIMFNNPPYKFGKRLLMNKIIQSCSEHVKIKLEIS